MRPNTVEVREYCFPSVEAPTAAEQRLLEQWRRALQEALSSGCRRWLGEHEVTVAPAELGDSGALTLEMGSQPLTGRLWLSPVAERRLVGGALGLSEAADVTAGVTGRAVQGVVARELLRLAGQAVGQDLSGAPPAGETGLWIGFGLRLGPEAEGRLSFPWAQVRQLARGRQPAGEGLPATLLEGAMVTLEALFPPVMAMAADLLALRVGDVLRLGREVELVHLLVEGQQVATGRAGARGDGLAISLSEITIDREGDSSAER